MGQMDWNQMRAFLATAETGSLSAAARKLKLTQPTLSRQVAALEARLGITLFERIGKTLVLTATGTDLLAHARPMWEAAAQVELAASGRSQAIEGLVNISATDGIAYHYLPEAITELKRHAPGIRTNIVVSNSLSDLQRREADIAIRHVEPKGNSLIAKKLRDAQAGFYASRAWIERYGRPRLPADLPSPDFVGFDIEGEFLHYLQEAGFDIDMDSFATSCNQSLVSWEMMRQGLGVGVMMTDIADKTPGIERIYTEFPLFSFPFWLVTHRELHTSRIIRTTFDVLGEVLGRRG